MNSDHLHCVSPGLGHAGWPPLHTFESVHVGYCCACNMPACTVCTVCVWANILVSGPGTPRARGPPHMGQIPKRRKPTHDQVQDLVLNAMGAAARRRGRGDHDPVRERPRGTFWTIFQDLWIKYLHYARHTVQGLRSLNLSRNGDELERPCEHRAQPAMPRRVLRQHASTPSIMSRSSSFSSSVAAPASARTNGARQMRDTSDAGGN